MITILIALIISFVVCVLLIKFSNNWGELLATMLMSCVVVAGLAYGIVAFNWYAAEYKANIINREYNTNYTAEEVFWARDVIDTIRHIDRQRIELNGDLMRGNNETK